MRTGIDREEKKMLADRALAGRRVRAGLFNSGCYGLLRAQRCGEPANSSSSSLIERLPEKDCF